MSKIYFQFVSFTATDAALDFYLLIIFMRGIDQL